MVSHAPLRLIAGGRDGKINRPVNQADTGAARAAGAFSNNIQQFLCDDRTWFLLVAARQHFLFAVDIGLDGAPFCCNLSGDRFGFHAEYWRRQLIALRRGVLLRRVQRIVEERSCCEIAGVERNEVDRSRKGREQRRGRSENARAGDDGCAKAYEVSMTKLDKIACQLNDTALFRICCR